MATSYVEILSEMEASRKNKEKIEKSLELHQANLLEASNQFVYLEEAQKILSTVSEENTSAVLDWVTTIINKTLAEIFKGDTRQIHLEKKMVRNRYVHINVELTDSSGRVRDLTLQSGTGLRQIISFLYIICLIEVRKDRRLLIMDEILSGVHPKAMDVILDVMKMFADSGWQFILVEHAIVSEKFGKMYHVEKPGKVARVYEIEKGTKFVPEVYLYTEGLRPEDLEDEKSLQS